MPVSTSPISEQVGFSHHSRILCLLEVAGVLKLRVPQRVPAPLFSWDGLLLGAVDVLLSVTPPAPRCSPFNEGPECLQLG